MQPSLWPASIIQSKSRDYSWSQQLDHTCCFSGAGHTSCDQADLRERLCHKLESQSEPVILGTEKDAYVPTRGEGHILNRNVIPALVAPTPREWGLIGYLAIPPSPAAFSANLSSTACPQNIPHSWQQPSRLILLLVTRPHPRASSNRCFSQSYASSPTGAPAQFPTAESVNNWFFLLWHLKVPSWN